MIENSTGAIILLEFEENIEEKVDGKAQGKSNEINNLVRISLE